MICILRNIGLVSMIIATTTAMSLPFRLRIIINSMWKLIDSGINRRKSSFFTKTTSVIPPLLPIVLPLRLLIVDYLKSCTSPLVNPVVGYPITGSNAMNIVNDSVTLTSTPDFSPAAKSQNTEKFNLDDVLASSAPERSYSVIVEKLTTDDINLWTGRVPLWSNIDPFSSISKVQTDSSDNESKSNSNLDIQQDESEPVHNL